MKMWFGVSVANLLEFDELFDANPEMQKCISHLNKVGSFLF